MEWVGLLRSRVPFFLTAIDKKYHAYSIFFIKGNNVLSVKETPTGQGGGGEEANGINVIVRDDTL